MCLSSLRMLAAVRLDSEFRNAFSRANCVAAMLRHRVSFVFGRRLGCPFALSCIQFSFKIFLYFRPPSAARLFVFVKNNLLQRTENTTKFITVTVIVAVLPESRNAEMNEK